MRNLLLVLAIGVSVSTTASAQSTADNLAKYHRLRDRLRTELIVLGTGPGEGMPAHIRHDGDGYIRWADATIDLGWYMAVLATEHHMLSRPSTFVGLDAMQTLQGTEDELGFALAALERLDRVGNASFAPPCTTDEALDGFFIRDDVPMGFHDRFGLSSTRSDSLDSVVTNKEMSQDQVWHLMMGLGLIAELVPAGASSMGRELRGWALEQLERILEHVAADDWIIVNPACMDRDVARGAVAFGYAYGASLAAEHLTDGRLVLSTDRVMRSVWDTLRDPGNAAYMNVDNLHMAMVVAAMGAGFGQQTPDVLATLAEAQGWWLYPLLHATVFGDEATRWCVVRDQVTAPARTLLDELPAAGEPSSPRPGTAPHSFTSSNRFIRGTAQAYVGPEGSAGERYHGLDFMLLHNVYAIAAPHTWEGGDAPAPGVCMPPAPDAGPVRADAGTADAGLGGDASGCGCRVGARGTAPWALGLWLVAMLIRRSRR